MSDCKTCIGCECENDPKNDSTNCKCYIPRVEQQRVPEEKYIRVANSVTLKKGDRVWCCKEGTGVVNRIDNDRHYPYWIKFDVIGTYGRYGLDGSYNSVDIEREHLYLIAPEDKKLIVVPEDVQRAIDDIEFVHDTNTEAIEYANRWGKGQKIIRIKQETKSLAITALQAYQKPTSEDVRVAIADLNNALMISEVSGIACEGNIYQRTAILAITALQQMKTKEPAQEYISMPDSNGNMQRYPYPPDATK